MKSSLLAITTAFALTLGASSVSFAQDTNTATNAEDCLVQQGAGATPTGESLTTEGDTSQGDAGETDTPAAEGLDVATGDAVACPDIEGGTDDDDAN
ncbi:hypothetical protein [Devosia rhizoryzae]|uniref:Secreted protein n=1 Tax=Devosia rhizoryzae TaxID=2774137 RepID=A0ABX7C408_9HYPH|nr:hypothetical protein [Devosia rhizoryzae]QQR38826.1 hypothetical protein JI748_13865 [Devosia rhizoryzae]